MTAEPIPCPNCRKPIQPGAANCWACGTVFDTKPCPHCDSAVKRGAVTCWFCGADILAGNSAPSPPEPVRSESIQTTPSTGATWQPASENCTGCGEKLEPRWRWCPLCGKQVGATHRKVHWEDRPAQQPHRGGTLLTLAIISLFCCGIIIGPIVAIRASIDLGEMREERMDRAGEGMTRAAQVIGIASAVIHGALVILRMVASR